MLLNIYILIFVITDLIEISQTACEKIRNHLIFIIVLDIVQKLFAIFIGHFKDDQAAIRIQIFFFSCARRIRSSR